MIVMFKVGDVVRGLKFTADGMRSTYSITNERMTEGEVINVYEDGIIEVKVLVHPDSWEIGEAYSVHSKYFELIEEIKPNKQDDVKIDDEVKREFPEFKDMEELELYLKESAEEFEDDKTPKGVLDALCNVRLKRALKELKWYDELAKIEDNYLQKLFNTKYTDVNNLKVGDKIRLKPNSDEFKEEWPYTNSSMEPYFGKVVTVHSVSDKTFRIEEDNTNWSYNKNWIENNINATKKLADVKGNQYEVVSEVVKLRNASGEEFYINTNDLELKTVIKVDINKLADALGVGGITI